MVLQISEDLAQEIEQEAKQRGVSIEKFLQTVVRRDRTMAAREKIEREQTWWLQQPLEVRAKYQGQYIAVHKEELVDHDKNEKSLFQRIRLKYGNIPILIMPADAPKDIYIYSPRLEQS